MGQINVSPSGARRTKPASLFITMLHELTHVLGFTSEDYPNYRAPGGGARLGGDGVLFSDRVFADDDSPAGKVVFKWRLNNALAAARAHFGCPTLNGIELEDYNSGGQETSHWETRILREELMAPALSDRSRFSSITLGALKDTGWYDVLTNAPEQDMAWGRMAGCAWVTEKCSKWTGKYELCDKDASITDDCTYARDAWGSCPLATYSANVPLWARYNDEQPDNYGGVPPELDFCPIVQPYANTLCTDPSNQMSSWFLGTTHTPASRCLRSSLVSEQVSLQTRDRPGCFPHRCIGLELEIRVGTGSDFLWKRCPRDGGNVAVDGYRGVLQCPPANTFCCASGCVNGECVDNVCLCDKGWGGSSCNQCVSALGNCPTRQTTTVSGVVRIRFCHIVQRHSLAHCRRRSHLLPRRRSQRLDQPRDQHLNQRHVRRLSRRLSRHLSRRRDQHRNQHRDQRRNQRRDQHRNRHRDQRHSQLANHPHQIRHHSRHLRRRQCQRL